MKPEQFIREYGVENVKTLIEDYEKDQFAFKSFDPAADCCFDAGLCMGQEKAWWDICIYDLKRLVESLDLVESWGGIDDVKLYDLSHCKDKPESAGYKLLQAIADYESIYGGGQ
ncbi:hypothetical protein ACXLRP_003502 [Acinetobacter baumannii]|uniref:hypothetical protein n=1 Tax=Acinetobacter baumannii TaxID=470 RepID=UPI0003DF1542|nr:hypothetical protein [Acinetobacter baumannii]EJD6061782.1 hypothetical protein [Acinetobacter baumannii]EKU0962538.1 hypothetical protein [Acinetobacter baumannii]EKU2652077.1 hypothetical protein [Acinetobacter baumannii]EKW2534404.1 hypothetical protein [Acinetobacter baumannii]ELT5726967.1 hypothetical protein [Acinetobacter baumannii]